eukprot:TRINITY_DN23603_c0_g1_i1.p1 TRINITY_DN23603_c0_g1~~TRINITY_DN23603_c0_g1_i1.p1  ORF type:complete len:646 (+),score=116.84 TRINITY_DN23603_c0_g1_i1:112-2049(+)
MADQGCIRPACPEDYSGIIALARQVAQESDAYTWDETATDEELSLSWLPEPEQLVETFVLEVDGVVGPAGVYVIHPAAAGRGCHIAHGLYMVAPSVRSKGFGRLLCSHSIRQAKETGYTGMRINMVVSTNVAAMRVCAACGFRVICTLPRAFQHPQRGLVDAHVMFHDLDEVEVAPGGILGAYEKPALHYPTTQTGGVVVLQSGDEVKLRPQLSSGSGGITFEVDPKLPAGLHFDTSSGTISGSPVDPIEETQYSIKATISAEITLRVEEAPAQCADEVSMSINEDFATQVQNITKVEDMLPEPSKLKAYGDWMIWMVHRAWLNDPSLEEFNFSNMHMPPPHAEPRIAPKLMAAMERNTHILDLSLSNSNMQKAQAVELAASLRKNETLRNLNLESNCLDSNAVREIALAVKDNPQCGLCDVRFCHQKQMGQFFGRPTEEAVGQMMQANELIVRLGFECDDAHWRNIIDRAVLRNNDFLRRRQAPSSLEELPPTEERTLGQIFLTVPPQAGATEALSNNDLLCGYLVQNLKLPTTAQLQSYARNMGSKLSYTEAAPLIKECRSWMLGAVLNTEVVVTDSFGSEVVGRLREWKEKGENWIVDLWLEDGRRSTFRSAKEPGISVSNAWLNCLAEVGRRPSVGHMAGA